MTTETENAGYEGWAILELMGHRRIAGFVTKVEPFGQPMVRIDIYDGAGDEYFTQFYGPDSIYCMTPTTEETARAVAGYEEPRPVSRWDMRQMLPAPTEDEEPAPEDYAPAAELGF